MTFPGPEPATDKQPTDRLGAIGVRRCGEELGEAVFDAGLERPERGDCVMVRDTGA